jgi:malonyl CoA-acyl carrier protein transacylase
MGRQSQRFVLDFRGEAGDDCHGTSGGRSNRDDSEPGRTRFVKTNDEMAQVRALIASLLAEKAEIMLRIERAAAVIAGALRDLEGIDRLLRRLERRRAPMDDVMLESSGGDCA